MLHPNTHPTKFKKIESTISLSSTSRMDKKQSSPVDNSCSTPKKFGRNCKVHQKIPTPCSWALTWRLLLASPHLWLARLTSRKSIFLALTTCRLCWNKYLFNRARGWFAMRSSTLWRPLKATVSWPQASKTSSLAAMLERVTCSPQLQRNLSTLSRWTESAKMHGIYLNSKFCKII